MKGKTALLTAALLLSLSVGSHIYAEGNQPVELTADTIEYSSAQGVITARGAVTITQNGAVMTGTNAEYNTKTKEAHITGGVKVVQDKATLTADEVRSYDNTHVVAIGNVLLVNSDNTLTGPQLDYYTDREYAVVDNGAHLTMPDGVMTAAKIEAYMAEDRAVGTGNVHIVSETRNLDATSDHADYYGAKNGHGKVVLSGNARAVQEGNVLTGNTLTIYLDDKAMDAQGRTKLVIKPQ